MFKMVVPSVVLSSFGGPSVVLYMFRRIMGGTVNFRRRINSLFQRDAYYLISLSAIIMISIGTHHRYRLPNMVINIGLIDVGLFVLGRLSL
jgi:hypothetical protein